MNTFIGNVAKIVYTLVLSIMLLNCGGTTYINASHSRHHVKEKVLPLVAGKSVSLKNYYQSSEQVTIFEDSSSTVLLGDLRQYTDATISILTSELRKRDVLVSDSNYKTVTIKISNVYATNKPFNKSTSLDITALFGNGKSTAISATYKTAGSSAQALDGAIIAAITQLLKSKAFANYINQ